MDYDKLYELSPKNKQLKPLYAAMSGAVRGGYRLRELTAFGQSINILRDGRMLNRVSEYIKENNLIEDGDNIVVGVSGGADSVCLLTILWELYRQTSVGLIAVHINHGIRGKAADEDEQFVRSFAKRLEIPFYGFRYEVAKIAAEKGLTLEEAGREVRYEAFLDICRKLKCNKIAIAHNRNDNAETVLFNLFRGSGIKGLTGIGAKRTIEMPSGNVTVIRPLLYFRREEIEEYLKEKQLIYRTDASNLEEEYSRNKLRNRVLTYVTGEINPGAVDHIAEAAEDLLETESFIGKQIAKRFTELITCREEAGLSVYEFNIEEVGKEDIVLRKGILLRILESLAGSRKDIGRRHVEELLGLFTKQVGKRLNLPYGILAVRGYHTIRITLRQGGKGALTDTSEDTAPVKLQIPGITQAGIYHKILEAGICNYEKGKPFPKNSCTKWFDYDKIENAVEVRTRNEGDYLQINPQGGNKKLKDYYIDVKLPREERNRMLLIADGSHIMWIPGAGDRMSEKYKITDATHRILWINLYDAEEKEDGR
jgi:tRNA(Ile)-lysidine synthase